MPVFYFKILLRYRNVIVIPLPFIILIIMAKYVMSVRDLPVNTTIFFLMFLLFSIGDLFLTIYDASCDESAKYLVYPIKHYYLILHKNMAVLLVAIIYSFLMSSIIIYVFRQPINSIIIYFIYFLSIVFPFISIGNLLSSSVPKINSNNYVIMRMILSSIIIPILSIPYGIIMLLFKNTYVALFYVTIVVLIWYYVSIPIAVKILIKNSYKMAETK